MNLLKDSKDFYNAMGSLPWPIQAWGALYPLPQVIGGLFFITTGPGLVILIGRVASFIIQTQVHKKVPFSKMTGPIGHAHWLLIVPYLLYALITQDISQPLRWFITYVLATTAISAVFDIRETIAYMRQGHRAFKKE